MVIHLNTGRLSSSPNYKKKGEHCETSNLVSHSVFTIDTS